VEYRKRPGSPYFAALRIELGSGEVLTQARALVDTGATKCVIPREDNERLLHFSKAGCDGKVDTALGEASYDWVVVPRMTLMMKREINIGPLYVTYALEETDLSLDNVEAWLGDDYMIGMNFIDKFDVTMSKAGIMTFRRD